MDSFEKSLQQVGAFLSRLLEPVASGLERLGYAIRQQLDFFGVPHQWHSAILTGAWILALLLVVKTLSGWLRLVVLVLVGIVLAKVYGVLPGG